jgi:hypothetical protein
MSTREVLNIIRITGGVLFIIVGIVNVQFYSPEYYREGQAVALAGMIILSTIETKNHPQ